MNNRIKKKHIKQYLQHPNKDSILVFEVDIDKVNFTDAADYFTTVTENLLCTAILIPKKIQLKSMDKEVAINYLKEILNFLEE